VRMTCLVCICVRKSGGFLLSSVFGVDVDVKKHDWRTLYVLLYHYVFSSRCGCRCFVTGRGVHLRFTADRFGDDAVRVAVDEVRVRCGFPYVNVLFFWKMRGGRASVEREVCFEGFIDEFSEVRNSELYARKMRRWRKKLVRYSLREKFK